jgi:hypothetical protein
MVNYQQKKILYHVINVAIWHEAMKSIMVRRSALIDEVRRHAWAGSSKAVSSMSSAVAY